MDVSIDGRLFCDKLVFILYRKRFICLIFLEYDYNGPVERRNKGGWGPLTSLVCDFYSTVVTIGKSEFLG